MRIQIAALIAALSVTTAAATPKRVEPPFPTEFARRAAQNQLNLSRDAADWGVSFEVRNGAAFHDAVGATFEATAVLKDPDTVAAEITIDLGRDEAVSIGVALDLEIGANGVTSSGNGKVSLNGSGFDLNYDRSRGWGVAVTAQRALATVGVKIGGDGRSPVDLGLDLGVIKVKVDALQLGRQVSQVLPELARAAGKEVGGVSMKTDLGLLAAALAKAPLPLEAEMRGLTVVSLRRLLPDLRASRTPDLKITSLRGLIIEPKGRDVQLLGIAEPGKPAIRSSYLVALLRSILNDGRFPFVSLDPVKTTTGYHLDRLEPRMGGVSPGLEKCDLLAMLLDADDRLKLILHGGVPGIPSAQEVAAARLARSPGTGGLLRFWYAPRPSAPGDISIFRSASGTVVRFRAGPELLAGGQMNDEDALTAPRRDVREAPGYEVAAAINARLERLEQARPELRLKELRQAFEIATAVSILAVEKVPESCLALLREVADLPVPEGRFRKEFILKPHRAPIPGGRGEVTVWGGVEARPRLEGAPAQADPSLNRLLAPAPAAAWKRGFRTLSGGFEPEVIRPRPLAPAELALPFLIRAAQAGMGRDYEAVLRESEAALLRDPASEAARDLRCRALYYQNSPQLKEAAAEWLRRVPNDWRAHVWTSAAFIKAQEFDDALKYADQAVRLAPKERFARCVRAGVRDELGDHRGAIEDLTAAKDVEPSSNLYVLRGHCWRRVGDMQAAVLDYTEALELDPSNAEACHQRAVVHGILARHDLALKDYERLFEIQPTAQNLGHVAGLRLQQKDLPGALRDLNDAIRMDPTGGLLYSGRSFAYEGLGQLKEALADVETAIDLYRRQRGPESRYALPALERRLARLRERLMPG